MDEHYQRMAAAIDYLVNHWRQQPDLTACAARAGLSPWHFQREFRRHVGVSPKRLLRYLAGREAVGQLRRGVPLLEAGLAAGLSGPGRLHDLTVSLIGLTPGAVRRGGEGLVLRHGIHRSPLGPVQLLLSPRGLTELRFVQTESVPQVQAALQARWPRATLVADRRATAAVMGQLFAGGTVTLAVAGTNFQLRVWEALLRIPAGETTSYGALAQAVGAAGAARAVGTAVGANPVAVLIPCHRVIRASGALGGYRWGLMRKQVLLRAESSA